MLDVLKLVGVELTWYHGGNLTRMDIKQIIANATFIFNEFKKTLLEDRKNDGMSEEAIKKMCADHKTFHLLWNGAFSLARMVDPSDGNTDLYKRYVFAAVCCHVCIGCNVTHKIHSMWLHVADQMKYVPGGLGEKMEDWVER